LWASFAFATPTTRIYIGGYSGYYTHFSDVGEQVNLNDTTQQFGQWWREVKEHFITIIAKAMFNI